MHPEEAMLQSWGVLFIPGMHFAPLFEHSLWIDKSHQNYHWTGGGGRGEAELLPACLHARLEEGAYVVGA